MMSEDGFEEVRRRAAPLLKRYGVRRVAIFGSFARGDEKGERHRHPSGV